MTFGSILRVLRHRNNLTQKELGIALGLSESTIGMYERGHREPDLETLESIADYFNVDMDYLTGRSPMELKDKIRNLRAEQHKTLEYIAKIVGVSKSTVRKWESGDIANMRRDKIAKLASALDTTPEYLMGWEIGNNIRYLRKSHGMSQEQLSDALGYKSYTTIQKWESGVSEPPLKIAHAIADIFHVDIDDLTKSDLSAPSHPLPGAFDVPATRRIPLLGRIAAGLPLYAEENIEGYIWTDKNHGAEYFGLRVSGDSMNAAGIKDGDIVVVRKQEELQPNEIGVILVDDGATIKRMQRKGSLVILNPQSTNPENTPQMYDLKEHTIKVIVKVVESRTEYI